ncbi:hypothetical protein QN277_000210 [Acacia crassicarpa]|uniref:Zinc finger PHD-type domain-containing protein n=1 Tax=Acacia crassicarpa TaxID=499986 RepID=A0AAE1TGW8_9FABA|nr:hypothetical protein QN277_000210 [Acacia crassicarpa]
MVLIGRKPLKRMKTRVTADFYDFLTFPPPSLVVADEISGGPFRTNVRSFLSKHALLPPPSALFPHLLTWQILFRVGDQTDGPDSTPSVVCLDVVEEDVARSRSVYCDQCRVVGWSDHPVCSKRYHFIIKADGSSIGGYHKPCMCCGDILHLSESKCRSCSHVTTTDDVEDWVYHQLENTTHLLHGVFHANGYGHLLRVNGREGGSRVLSGFHIMNFWDRLCKSLGAREVSVMDVSRKYGLEYRLIHAITKGHPWYGDWGYQFGTGSYGLTHEAYKSAVEFLSSLPLSLFLSEGKRPDSRLQDTISYYQSLSETGLVTIRDLFCFLIGLIHDARMTVSRADDVTCKKRCCNAAGVSCFSSMSDIERVEGAMLRVLRAVSGSNWVSQRTLKGAVCKVASPELLDYCLGEIGGKAIFGGMVVNTQCNPVTGASEYRLEAGNSVSYGTTASNNKSMRLKYPSEVNLLHDLRYLYESFLHPHKMLSYDSEEKRNAAMSYAQKLLDCKHFVKDYRPEMVPMTSLNRIRLSCQVVLVDETDEAFANPPPELIVLPWNATVFDLKTEASNAFQDVYLMCKIFQVDELFGCSSADDSTSVKLLVGSTELVRVRGKCIGKNVLSRFQSERGLERWTVDCSCGAKDDDGERMLACDACGVWRHTRCSGILDADPVPVKFFCPRCQNFELRPYSSGH